jgi:hypothetical protein
MVARNAVDAVTGHTVTGLCKTSVYLSNSSAPDHDECNSVASAVDIRKARAHGFDVPEPKKIKNRIHLGLRPETSRDQEVERLMGLGATFVSDHRNPDGTGWAVLADPEGNEFCVLRSESDRAATR